MPREWKPNRPVSDFSEASYLGNNPDVAAAVASGKFRSGWDHFLLYGHAEDRQGAPAEVEPAVDRVLKDPRQSPIPPSGLRARVHGAEDLPGFIRMGKTIALDIHATLNSKGIDSEAGHRILDFGCGCGRVLTWLRYLYPNSELHATDIDREAIEWCRKHLGEQANFATNQNDPPLAYDDGQFDLVFSVSIFTHLPETMQFAWLDELNRITHPGGILLLTIRGARFFPGRSRRAKRKLEKHGFYYFKRQGTYGLPGFYQQSYHGEDYVRRKWSRYFEILEIQDQGIAGNQDLVICRKRQAVGA